MRAEILLAAAGRAVEFGSHGDKVVLAGRFRKEDAWPRHMGRISAGAHARVVMYFITATGGR